MIILYILFLCQSLFSQEMVLDRQKIDNIIQKNLSVPSNSRIMLSKDEKIEFLFDAILYNNVSVVKNLINSDKTILHESFDTCYYTPFLWAALYNRFDILKYLVEQGVDVHARDFSGRTAIHNVICNMYCKAFRKHDVPGLAKNFSSSNIIKTLQYLLNLGLNIDAKDNQNNTALHLAAQYGQINYDNGSELIRYLIAAGSNKNEKNLSDLKPLDYAWKYKNYTNAIYLSLVEKSDLA